jgi:hypothetical protein
MNLIELCCNGWTAMSIEIAGQGLSIKLAARYTKLLSEVLSGFKIGSGREIAIFMSCRVSLEYDLCNWATNALVLASRWIGAEVAQASAVTTHFGRSETAC